MNRILIISVFIFHTVCGTASALTLTIPQIQGAGHLSPYAEQEVENVEGLVTKVIDYGFFMQDPQGDGQVNTSDGIFVYTAGNAVDASGQTVVVAAGDRVFVKGKITEYRKGSDPNNLTITELTLRDGGLPVVVSIVAQNQSLPVPVIIGKNGRMPPTEIIDNDATGNIETSGVFQASEDGIDFYESLEGMLVKLEDAVATGPTSRFGEIAVVPDLGIGFGERTVNGGLRVRQNDFNPERIILDDVFMKPAPKVVTGTTFSNAILGIVDYSFGNFKLLNFDTLLPDIRSLSPEVSSLAPSQNGLLVASINVFNLAPADTEQGTSLAKLIVDHLHAPDIMGMQEIQDNSGTTNDGTIAADQTWQMLIDAIQNEGGPTYQFREIAPDNNADGGVPGGNIRVGFLFNPNRVAFVDRGLAGPTDETVVQPGPSLSLSPGRIQPAHGSFVGGRKPLAGEFLFNDHKIFLIVNHLRSKGGDTPLFGTFQPPIVSSEQTRISQAEVVRDFVIELLREDPSANVIVMGDFNDFEFSASLEKVKDAGLTNLAETVDGSRRYSYIYEGNSQTLDHILVSSSLTSLSTADYVHVNADFVDENFRASDHDPAVAFFDFEKLDSGAPVLTPTGVNLHGTIEPEDGQLKVSGQTVAVDQDGSWTYSLPVPNGQWQFTLELFDPNHHLLKTQLLTVSR